jgi:hypothetical protein
VVAAIDYYVMGSDTFIVVKNRLGQRLFISLIVDDAHATVQWNISGGTSNSDSRL